mmetsp:Transcript_138116/g.344883  ORF Transcript_138116/g.344883 Transcript_138116/m.344883 type:complete len:278 (-) Transcript_138116:75-908(-)
MRTFGRVLFTLGSVAVLRARCQEYEGEEMEDEIEQDALTSEQMRGMHTKIDANGNGKISFEEIMAFSSTMRKIIASKDIGTVLDEMDGDKDGKLSLDELIKDMEQWGEGEEEDKAEADARMEVEKLKFKTADRDGDGLLSNEELPALFYPETHEGVLEITAKAAMKTKDTNGDGKLTPKEFWEGDVVDGEELAISEEEQSDFKKLDKNGDGVLDLDELKAWESGMFHTEEAMKKLFELADRDNDMHVSAEELDAAREQIAGTDAQYHLMEWAEHHEL